MALTQGDVTVTNLIQGPAYLWWAPFGTAEPATPTERPGTGWIGLGGTNDGVSMNDASEWSELTVDQLVETPGRVRIKREMSIKTSLAEATLRNHAIATSNALPTLAEGIETLTPDSDVAGFLPAYGAVILDGVAPGGQRRRLVLRRTLSTDAVESAYKKDGQLLVPVNFVTHYVSSSIPSWRIQDVKPTP